MEIWYILGAFGIFCGNLVYFFPFWYVVPRKIWQPWTCYPCLFFILLELGMSLTHSYVSFGYYRFLCKMPIFFSLIVFKKMPQHLKYIQSFFIQNVRAIVGFGYFTNIQLIPFFSSTMVVILGKSMLINYFIVEKISF
jgi:hypothetical protein